MRVVCAARHMFALQPQTCTNKPLMAERWRAFVRIRIYRICGIFRISFAQLARFAIIGNPAKPNMYKPRRLKTRAP